MLGLVCGSHCKCMRLPQNVVEKGMLRTSASANGQTMPDRAQIGEIVTITVVTIVFTEIVIEAVAITIGVTVTATVAAGVAESFAKRRKKRVSCQENLIKCLGSDWGGKPGNNRSTTLCPTCFGLCQASLDKQWPSQIGTGQSCIYPGYEE